MKNKSGILGIICIILAFTYSLSFTKSCSTDKEKSVKTALINPDKVSKINFFQIVQNDEALSFVKNGNFWFVENDGKNIIANQKTINKFFDELTEIRSVYKISDKIKETEPFFTLIYSADNSQYELFFQNQDFSKTFRYFSASNNASLFKVDSSFEEFLTVALQYWTAPEIFSSEVLSSLKAENVERVVLIAKDKTTVYTSSDKNFQTYIQKILELRNGGRWNNNEKNQIEKASLVLKLELGNKDEAVLKAFENSEDESYNLQVQYKKDGQSNDEITEAFCRVSKWTLSQLLNE